MYIILRGTLETTFVTAYFPQSDRPTEEKEHIYEKLQNIIDKRKNKGPIYIGADWNARLIYPTTENEETIMGKFTLHNNGNKIEAFTEAMKENRDLMIEFCLTNEMKVVNTMYKKRPEQTATYRRVGIDIDQPINKDTHEQLDYIVTAKRWRNAITNAESDTKANIDSDHYPVLAKATLRLKAEKLIRLHRCRYMKCEEEERKEVINKLEECRPEEEDTNYDTVKNWLTKGRDLLPKEKPIEKHKKQRLSYNTIKILEDRGRAKKSRDLEEYERLNKLFRKAKKKIEPKRY